MNSLAANWKTTVQGILTCIIGLSALATAPQINILTPKWAGILALSGAVAKIVLGVFQKDAGVVMATVPGNPIPQAVPAHPIPDNPAATPVVPKVNPNA